MDFENLWKWFAEQWTHLITHHFEGMLILGTSLLGSFVGLRREERVSFGLGLVVVVTSATTSILLAKLAEHYFALPDIAVLAVAYFLGTIGNRLTLAFMKAAGVFLNDPLGTLKYVYDVVKTTAQIILKIKKDGGL